jgi:replicative DNA helicase
VVAVSTDPREDAPTGSDQLHADEQATLGACLLNPTVAADVALLPLAAADFAYPHHRNVWDAIQDLRTAGTPVDANVVAGHLHDNGRLARLPGGAAYLHTLTEAPANVLAGTTYAKRVKAASTRRELVRIATQAVDKAAGADDPLAIIAATQRALAGLTATTAADSLVRWGTIADGALDGIEAAGQHTTGTVGLPTGITDLDRLLGGFQNGRLYLVGALSGAGKSVLLGDFFRAWMNHKIPCCLVTVEMGRDEVWRRQAAAACRIPHHALNEGRLSDEDWSRLARWIADTNDAPAWICDKPRMTLTELDALIMRGVEQHGWRGAVVDYAQIIKHPAPTREREVAQVASGLKEIARKANIPVITGAQLNREANRRPGGVPKMSDLRESAALEHESDCVILIHRPDYEDHESPRAGEADLILPKNRGGPKDTVTVAAQMHFQRFLDMAVA